MEGCDRFIVVDFFVLRMIFAWPMTVRKTMRMGVLRRRCYVLGVRYYLKAEPEQPASCILQQGLQRVFYFGLVDGQNVLHVPLCPDIT